MIILRKVAFIIVPRGSEAAILALYFFVPAILVIFLVVTYHFLNSIAPTLMSVMSGGRGKSEDHLPREIVTVE
jgi:hypothetical protein